MWYKALQAVLPMLPGSLIGDKRTVEDQRNYDFAEALTRLKQGDRVRRKGWAGTEMWVLLIPARSWNWTVTLLTSVHPLPWLALRTADGDFVPWVPAHADILADDWQDS